MLYTVQHALMLFVMRLQTDLKKHQMHVGFETVLFKINQESISLVDFHIIYIFLFFYIYIYILYIPFVAYILIISDILIIIQ